MPEIDEYGRGYRVGIADVSEWKMRAITAESTIATVRELVEDAVGHVGAARMQTIPSDDEIIAGHVRDAETKLTQAFRALSRSGTSAKEG